MSYRENDGVRNNSYDKERRAEENHTRDRKPLKERLKKELVGQEIAINGAADAINQKQNGWADKEKPLVLLLLGGPGLGKTEMTKIITKHFNINERNNENFHFDMCKIKSQNDYSFLENNIKSTQRFGNINQTFETPYTVVVLDKIEMASEEAINTVFPLFENKEKSEGDLSNTIFIMTSNLAQQQIAENSEEFRREFQKENRLVREKILPVLRENLKNDSLLSLIDEVLIFLPLNENEQRELVKVELKRLFERVKKSDGILFNCIPSVEEALLKGYDENYGARSIKNEVRRRITSKILEGKEAGKIKKGDSLAFFEKEGVIEMQLGPLS